MAGALPLVKVCGLTRAADASLAASLGVWALGFVFAESPRQVSPEQARAVAREVTQGAPAGGTRRGRVAALERAAAVRPRLVGVFRDATLENVAATVDEVGLDGVQLHGAESPADVVRLRDLVAGRGRPLLVIKALGVRVEANDDGMPAGRVGATEAARLEERAAAFRPVVDLLLLDTCVGGVAGGTGVSFPWEAARPLAASGPVLVAGGLKPETARAALRLTGAAGVDISSGVETAPGAKDQAALRRLFMELSRPTEEDRDR